MKMLLTGVKDLDMKILNELEDVDLINVCQTNKTANEICRDQNFWLNRIMIKFSEVPLDVLNNYKDDRSWSEYYIEDLRKLLSPHPAGFSVTSHLGLALENRRLDKALILSRMTENLSINPEYGLTIIGLASDNGSVPTLEYLIKQRGMNVNVGNPLYWTSYNDQLDAVKYLVENGAEIDREDLEKRTALMAASSSGSLEIVKYLVENGAEINREDREKSTALIKAANGSLDVVKYLVENGANIDHKDKYGSSAAHTTRDSGTLKYLLSIGASIY